MEKLVPLLDHSNPFVRLKTAYAVVSVVPERARAGVCNYKEYEPFGDDFGATNSERYKFTGKEDDGATELTYFNARYYDPAVGRFMTEDPAKDGWNWYQYVRNNRVPR